MYIPEKYNQYIYNVDIDNKNILYIFPNNFAVSYVEIPHFGQEIAIGETVPVVEVNGEICKGFNILHDCSHICGIHSRLSNEEVEDILHQVLNLTPQPFKDSSLNKTLRKLISFFKSTPEPDLIALFRELKKENVRGVDFNEYIKLLINYKD